jgi:hypothetical protein
MLIRLNTLNQWQTDMENLCETCTHCIFKQEDNNGNERFFDFCEKRYIKNPQMTNCEDYDECGFDNI